MSIYLTASTDLEWHVQLLPLLEHLWSSAAVAVRRRAGERPIAPAVPVHHGSIGLAAPTQAGVHSAFHRVDRATFYELLLVLSRDK